MNFNYIRPKSNRRRGCSSRNTIKILGIIAVFSLLAIVSDENFYQGSAVTTVTITSLNIIKNNTSKCYKAVTHTMKMDVCVTLL